MQQNSEASSDAVILKPMLLSPRKEILNPSGGISSLCIIHEYNNEKKIEIAFQKPRITRGGVGSGTLRKNKVILKAENIYLLI